jgi:hypothetical protein
MNLDSVCITKPKAEILEVIERAKQLVYGPDEIGIMNELEPMSKADQHILHRLSHGLL